MDMINLYAWAGLHYALIFQEWTLEIKETSVKMIHFQPLFHCIYSGNQKTEWDFSQPGNAEEVPLFLHHPFLELWTRWPQGDLTAWQKPPLTYYKGRGDGQEYVS